MPSTLIIVGGLGAATGAMWWLRSVRVRAGRRGGAPGNSYGYVDQHGHVDLGDDPYGDDPYGDDPYGDDPTGSPAGQGAIYPNPGTRRPIGRAATYGKGALRGLLHGDVAGGALAWGTARRALGGGPAVPGDLQSFTQYLFHELVVRAPVEWPDGYVLVPAVVEVQGCAGDVTFAEHHRASIERGVNTALRHWAKSTPVRQHAPVRFVFTVDGQRPPGHLGVIADRPPRSTIPATSAPPTGLPPTSGPARRRVGRPPLILHPLGEVPLCPPVELAHGVSVVGRDPSACTVVLNHPSVSRVHARVDVGAAASGAPVVTVQDLQSTNRTCLHRSGSADVRERMVTDAVEVRDGDVLFFGDVKLRLTIGTSAMEPTGTVPGAGRRQPGGEHAAAAPPAPAPGPAETTGELPFGALLSGESHRLDADGRRGGR